MATNNWKQPINTPTWIVWVSNDEKNSIHMTKRQITPSPKKWFFEVYYHNNFDMKTFSNKPQVLKYAKSYMRTH